MKKEYTPIAMRCDQKQFEDIFKPKLEKLGFKFDSYLAYFKTYGYLVNNYAGEDKIIGNNTLHNAEDYNRKVYETWNERIFLEACGVVEDKKFEITKEQIHKLENGFTLPLLKEWFPEVFEEELVVGEWKKVKGKNIIFCLYENGIYGFINGIEKTLNWDFVKKEELEFPKKHEVFESLRNEAVKRGFVFRTSINPIRDIENDKNIIFTTGSSFIFDNNKLYVTGYGRFCIFKKGQWATVIQPKQMTKSDIEKELGYKIEIV